MSMRARREQQVGKGRVRGGDTPGGRRGGHTRAHWKCTKGMQAMAQLSSAHMQLVLRDNRRFQGPYLKAKHAVLYAVGAWGVSLVPPGQLESEEMHPGLLEAIRQQHGR